MREKKELLRLRILGLLEKELIPLSEGHHLMTHPECQGWWFFGNLPTEEDKADIYRRRHYKNWGCLIEHVSPDPLESLPNKKIHMEVDVRTGEILSCEEVSEYTHGTGLCGYCGTILGGGFYCPGCGAS